MALTNHDPVRQESGAKATAVQTLRVINEPPGNRARPAMRETAAVDRRSRPPTTRVVSRHKLKSNSNALLQRVGGFQIIGIHQVEFALDHLAYDHLRFFPLDPPRIQFGFPKIGNLAKMAAQEGDESRPK